MTRSAIYSRRCDDRKFPPEQQSRRPAAKVKRIVTKSGADMETGPPQRQAESSSLSCGPIVHFRLLSTSGKNSVTFSE